MMHEIDPEPPLDAQPAVVRRSVERRVDAEDAIVFDVQIDLAADAAVGAGGAHDRDPLSFMALRIALHLLFAIAICHSTLPFNAPVGQTPTQLPQKTHVVSGIAASNAVVTWLSMPRPPQVSAKVFCTSSAQTWMQRQHMTHLRVVPDVERVVVLERESRGGRRRRTGRARAP